MDALAPPVSAGVARLGVRLGVNADDYAWQALAYFSIYRLALALLVGLAYWRFNDIFLIGQFSPGTAVPTIVAYLALAPLAVVAASIRRPPLDAQVFVQVMVDVAAVTALLYASGGARSGLGLLLLMTVAGAALISRGRLSLLYASVASIALLVQQWFHALHRSDTTAEWIQTGLVAAGYFAVAIVSQTLARNATVSQRIAEAAVIDLANLAAINELVVRDMQDGFLVVDGENRVRQTNPRARAMLGALPGDGVGVDLDTYCPELALCLTRWLRETRADRAPIRISVDKAEINVRIIDIGSADEPARVLFLEDASRLKAEARKVKLASLGRLSASIAHEIRNPLSAISHAADLMQEEAGRGAEDQRLVTIIRENVHRIDRMVEEVLYLNRRDHAKTERLRLSEYLAPFVDNFCAIESVPREAIHVQCESDAPFHFDRGHFDQILWNLLRNAWRHCKREPGSILLHAAREPGGLVAVEVGDDGAGVKPAALPHLFEPFFTTEAKGTGLGLYIARELAQANGGELEYVPPPGGQGALFRLTGRRPDS